MKAFAARRSVLLVGPPGVGKTSIVHALAARLKQTGSRRLYEHATVELLTGTVYLGEWQSKVSNLFDTAAKSNALLYFSDIWNLPTVGRSSTSTNTVWDALRPRLLRGDLQVVGEVSREQLLALGLVGQTRQYLDEKRAIGEDEPVTPEFVEKVFAVYSGLPRFVISRREVRPVKEIREWFRSRIVGQRDAIEAVIQMITLYKAGLHDRHKPIGSSLFVGPTGVGKTELARALATYLFGSERRLLRFDMSEFKDYHSFQMLIGDPGSTERPARLVDPVRAQPFQVVLLDEIEKAHANVWDLLLQLLDDGRLTPANGPAVNFRNTIVIATAHVGAQVLERRPVGFTGGTTHDDGARLQS